PLELNDRALSLLMEKGIAASGDHVILTRGDHMNAHGGTNTMKILDINERHGL
ncbi:pyruvate kinase alpha/beta domain-containing protein, partial [Halomonas sp.]|uniref:pyruvate kinase alpha/beta domain-containing protein n=1 Tax=Halomonas sp. TaxID=1486246 RepID=UPI0025BD0234